MTKLILPYALNNKGKLVHIDDANRGEKYLCPNCNAELSLRISKIPKGEKYHRRNHFAHKNNSDNHCSESFLHKLFKEKCIEYISNKIKQKEPIYFNWRCDKCNEKHNGNLLKKAVHVYSEYDLGICKPDIALLDKNGKVIIVIEIVVTHKPEEKVMQYYEENKIACLQINVSDFTDCCAIDERLCQPNSVNICPNPKCKICGHIMHKVKMVIATTECWRCQSKIKIALIKSANNNILTPKQFSQEDVNVAISNEVNIKKRYSKTMDDSYLACVCNHCNAFMGIVSCLKIPIFLPKKK